VSPEKGVPVSSRAGPDLRADPRQAVAVPVRLRLPTWKHVEILVTRDMSRGGMFLRSSRPLEVGTQLDLVLEPPEGESVSFPAEVVHVVPPGAEGPSGMGLRFLEIPAAALAALDRLLVTHSR
jgi:uncharacterized protein (TIGR02266 family)